MTIRITGGEARGRGVASPKGQVARPTSSKIRKALFNILGAKIVKANFLDVFAGSGIMGLEALSRGSDKLTCIEIDRKLAKSLEGTLETFNYEASIIVGDARDALKKLSKDHFDIIFADPPYQSNLAQSTVYLVDKNELLKTDGILIIEHSTSTKLDFEKTRLYPYDRRKYGQTELTLIKRQEEVNG